MTISPSDGTSLPVAAGTTPLQRRAADLASLGRETWDVVIVGGGIVGSGALLDAASRGMRAVLIEQEDIASGTSSRSSRLIHGGLRYLEQFRIGLVREALAERSRLLALAPHLVHLEPLLFPIYGRPYLSKAFYDAGLTLYDILGARRDGGWHRRLNRAETLDLAPTLRHQGLRGGLLYHDGVEDDARYTLAVARTAVTAGAVALTRIRATGVRTEPGTRRVQAVLATDLLHGGDVEIPTRAVVDATGVWAAEPEHPLGSGSLRILPSRGAHLVVRRERIPNRTGLTIRVPGKIVFLVPWGEHWLVGTTDAPFEGSAAHPTAAGWEVDKLLDTVNATMTVNLSRDDVVGTYAGLRPLIAPSDGSTVKASREHRVTAEPNGVVRIGGGKYTTYRVMALDVIDAVLGREAAQTRRSQTADWRLVGGADPA
ncbi:MAG: glycerol-3-phosphate dehydrogenase/oxidase, partial [Chloroflexi bacterium]|nr:glycerol-3-phosphate dehydrogenase/oxidase [Chloroflexota bacterium]